MLLTEKTVGMHICTSCTLNCELCATNVPLYKQKGACHFISFEDYQRELQELFRVYHHVERVSITGGEPLLHKDLAKMAAYTFLNYSAQFDHLRIITNGTLLPGEELLQTIHTYANDNILFVLDDYGKISNRMPELKELLEKNHIPYCINTYHGEEQHCGGWVDLGPLDRRRSLSEEETQELVSRCHFGQWKCLDCLNGKLYLCPPAGTGDYFHFFELKPDEYIDLFDDSQSLEEKQRIASGFGKKAITACFYCNGFDPERSQRFPAGVQVGGI